MRASRARPLVNGVAQRLRPTGFDPYRSSRGMLPQPAQGTHAGYARGLPSFRSLRSLQAG